MRSGVTLSAIADPDTFFTSAGNPVGVTYSPVIEDGRVVLAVSGKFSIPDYINSFADSTDMSFIIARLKAGDDSVLNVVPESYGDTTIFPANRAAMLQTVIDAQNTFDHLDQAIKDRFHNDFHSWFAEAGSQAWIDKMQADLQKFGGNGSAAITDPVDQDTAAIKNPANSEINLANEVK